MDAWRKCVPVKGFLKGLARRLRMRWLAGDAVQCPICGWWGARFMDGSWHKRAICPQCEGDIRHRLVMASFRYLAPYRSETFLAGKKILHFAPEPGIAQYLRQLTKYYVTADLHQQGVDLKIDISDMPEIPDGSYDVVIAADILEHVTSYHQALREVHRILQPGGSAVITVPQKDNLEVTYEDPAITDPQERTRAFGELTHLRIFGADFPAKLASAGFRVSAVDAESFEEKTVFRHVLKPPVLSKHPLATNHRRIFFCFKKPGEGG